MSGRPARILRSRLLLLELMEGRHNTVTLAQQAGVRKQVISYLTSGARTSCSERTAERIAAALGCEVKTLFWDPLEEDSSAREEEEMQALTIPEAGEAIGVSRAHAYRLVAEGSLKTIDVALGRSKKPKSRVPVKEIEAFMARRAAEQQS